MEYNGNPESVGYKIKYSRADGRGKMLSHVVQDRVEREYTIEDLEEWTEYRVQIQAFNAIGSGPWSQMVMGRTRESGTAPCSQPPCDFPRPAAETPPPLSLCPQGLPRAGKLEPWLRTAWAPCAVCAQPQRPCVLPVPQPLTVHTARRPLSGPSHLALAPGVPGRTLAWGVRLAPRTPQKHDLQLRGAWQGVPCGM